ncbi:MAG: hypothetical protein HeimC2_11800 [Candidatus Heimdallarchaeota archaeon LC_2]|nr:MAG: hypothetical protein HeimC2_11800 [Candidatus Heimdallarchaeota archaeon LC_2]
MEASQSDLIDLYGSFIFLFIAILFYYQTKRKHRDTPTLTYGFFIAFIGQLFNSITLILLKNDQLDPILGVYLQVAFITMLNLIIVFFWIFLEYTHSTQLNPLYVVLMSIAGTARILAIIMGDLLNDLVLGIFLSNVFFTIFLNIPALRTVFIQNKIYQATNKERTAGLQLLALTLIWIWAFFGLIINSLNFYNVYNNLTLMDEVYVDITDVIYYLGLIIFIFTIFINPEYIYRIPLNIQDIVLFSKSGIAVFGIGNNASEKTLDEQLLAGFITAANGFVNEMQPKYPIEAIQTLISTNRILRLEFGNLLGVCTVSNKENWYLRRSVKKFVKFLEEQNPQPLIDKGTFFEDKIVRDWLKIYFPYLAVNSMESY